ncbi:MAG: hypothetical protein ACTSYO_02585 [Candidatus Ranarchaeia archaeon]
MNNQSDIENDLVKSQQQVIHELQRNHRIYTVIFLLNLLFLPLVMGLLGINFASADPELAWINLQIFVVFEGLSIVMGFIYMRPDYYFLRKGRRLLHDIHHANQQAKFALGISSYLKLLALRLRIWAVPEDRPLQTSVKDIKLGIKYWMIGYVYSGIALTLFPIAFLPLISFINEPFQFIYLFLLAIMGILGVIDTGLTLFWLVKGRRLIRGILGSEEWLAALELEIGRQLHLEDE